MARRKSRVNAFNLSFLDIMSCGFGATILVFMIIHHSTLEATDETLHALELEAQQSEAQIGESQRYREELMEAIRLAKKQEIEIRGRADAIAAEIEQETKELAARDRRSEAEREHVNALISELRALEEEASKLEGGRDEEQSMFEPQNFLTDGDRQFLTGLKLGGDHILILLDVSASMLDSTIVNVIRRRNMSVDARRESPKWQRAVKTIEWVGANLPRESSFQVFAFNTEARPLVAGTEGRWLAASDAANLRATVDALREVVPDDGTSLYNAFEAAVAMSPTPDNILLITDGLPTQGKSPPRGRTVSERNRLRHFASALEVLPIYIPVNTVLFPMEGDPQAVAEFWKLALATGGSMMSPAEDWP